MLDLQSHLGTLFGEDVTYGKAEKQGVWVSWVWSCEQSDGSVVVEFGWGDEAQAESDDEPQGQDGWPHEGVGDSQAKGSVMPRMFSAAKLLTCPPVWVTTAEDHRSWLRAQDSEGTKIAMRRIGVGIDYAIAVRGVK